MFIDLSKAFDPVDHHFILQGLQNIAFCTTLLRQFANYLSGRTYDNCTSFIETMGVVLILDPI